jgi:hypothetical protein
MSTAIQQPLLRPMGTALEALLSMLGIDCAVASEVRIQPKSGQLFLSQR